MNYNTIRTTLLITAILAATAHARDSSGYDWEFDLRNSRTILLTNDMKLERGPNNTYYVYNGVLSIHAPRINFNITYKDESGETKNEHLVITPSTNWIQLHAIIDSYKEKEDVAFYPYTYVLANSIL